jgi:multidrug efflux system outer membrane protein
MGRTTMHKFIRSTLPAALLALSGCSFIPAHERPAAPVAASWPAPAAGQQALASITWQRMLPDPRLQALIQAALEHNRDLRIAVARVEEARALYGIARADSLPTLNLNASRSVAHTPGDLNASGHSQTSRRNDLALGVTSFELDFWGRVSSLNEAARASYLATEEAQAAFQLSLIADVAQTHLALQEFDERIALTRTTLENRRDLRALMQKRRDAGLAGELDLLSASAALESVRAELAALERGRAQTANALLLLVGNELPPLPAARTLSAQGMVLDIAVEAPAEALLYRPDVRAAELKLMAANANIGAARAAFLPRIGLNLGFGLAGASLSGVFDGGSGAWSFVPSLTLPLFDGGRTQAALDVAEARKVLAVAEYEKTLQQAFREVADILAARDRLAAQLQAQEAAETAQAERLKLAQARHLAGVSSYLEVLDAQRDAYAAQQGTLQTRRALLASAAQLYRALGGGRGQ